MNRPPKAQNRVDISVAFLLILVSLSLYSSTRSRHRSNLWLMYCRSQSARRPTAAEAAEKQQSGPPAPFAQTQNEQGQQPFQNQQRQQQPPRFPQHSPYPPYFNPYGPPPPNQRFGPQGFPPGQGFPGMPYGGPPPGWCPPPGQGFPNQGYGQFPPPQMPIGSGPQHNQQQNAPRAPSASQEQPARQVPEFDKPVATVKLPSSSTTPALPEATLNGPPPPTESKPDVAAALAPPAPTETKDMPITEKNVQAAQKNGRLVPAVPIPRISQPQKLQCQSTGPYRQIKRVLQSLTPPSKQQKHGHRTSPPNQLKKPIVTPAPLSLPPWPSFLQRLEAS